MFLESPLHLRKRVSILLSSPEDQLKKLVSELLDLRNELEQASSESTDPLSAIVPFLDKVSKWHDRVGEISDLIKAFGEVNWGQYTLLIEALEELQQHFINAGRDRYGWNRTNPGEKVTEDRVFLGNICGLFTHSVSYWKEKKDEKKGGWGFSGMDTLNSYDVVCKQAHQFMLSHTGPMLSSIQTLTN